MDANIPDNIATGVVAMLAPYCPGLTTERLSIAVSPTPPEPDLSEVLHTRTEAAMQLKVSLPTIDRMLRDGELPKRRIRGAVRIPGSAVKNLISGKGCDR